MHLVENLPWSGSWRTNSLLIMMLTQLYLFAQNTVNILILLRFKLLLSYTLKLNLFLRLQSWVLSIITSSFRVHVIFQRSYYMLNLVPQVFIWEQCLVSSVQLLLAIWYTFWKFWEAIPLCFSGEECWGGARGKGWEGEGNPECCGNMIARLDNQLKNKLITLMGTCML